MRLTSRVRASELQGRAWLNTGGRDLALAALRGKVVVNGRDDFEKFYATGNAHHN